MSAQKSMHVSIFIASVTESDHELCHYILLDEGVCILLECSSDDKSTREEVHSKVMQTARKMQLPDKTTNDILPGILVVC